MTIINHQGELFHYRGREEFQDNNAASFTFCPTDEIRPLHDTGPARQQHPQQLVQVQRVSHSSFSQPSSTYQFPPPHDVFNDHMKPDFVASRLRMGPSALRSAVDGSSTSPTRPARDSGWGGLLFSQGPESSMDQSNFFRRLEQSTSSSSDMNPSASIFTPTTTSSSPSSDELGALNLSLCKALTSERDAHIATKAALENETARRLEAEQESTRLAMNNKSLTASVQMLGSIIKHNVEKKPDHTKPTITTAKPKDEVRASKEQHQKSILHDALERQRVQYTTEEHIEPGSGGNKRNEGNFQVSHVNERDLFNLDLLRSPGLESISDNSALSRTLRKHFLNKSELTDDEKMTTPEKVFASDQLIHLSPEELAHKEIDTMGQITMGPTKAAFKTSAPESRPPVPAATSKRPSGLATIPQLGLPQAWLDKYRAPKRAFATSSDQGTLPPSPQATSSQPQSPERSIPISPTKSKFGANDNVASTNETTKSLRRAVNVINIPYGPTVYWAVNSSNTIFDDEYDMKAAERFCDEKERPSFWDNPVRYFPSMGEKNLYRTVMIDFIPLGTTYNEILKHVRTGAIESIQLLPPIGHSNDFLTARIVFHYELPARNLYVHDQTHGIVINGQRVRVWHLLYPTYPKGKQLELDVFEACYTRMLLITNIDEVQLTKLPHKLGKQIRAGFVIEISRSHDDFPLIEFTSVIEAVRAMRQLVTDPDFGGVVLDFEDDPCEVLGYEN